MKRFAQILVTFIIIFSLFIPSGLEFAGREISGVGEVEAATTTIAAISDFGSCTSNEASVATMVNGWGASAVVTGGDNDQDSQCPATYASSVGNYYPSYVTAPQTFFPVPGNHDYTPNINAYQSYFTWLPTSPDTGRRYYSKVIGDIEFFMIDSPGMIDNVSGAISNQTYFNAQQSWLYTNMPLSTAKWQIVMMHFPPFTSVNTHPSYINLQWNYATHGADAVISGHNHVYERVMHDDIPYFTIGLGGQSLYSFGTPLTESVVRYNSNYGAMKITTTDLAMTFDFLSLGNVSRDTYSVAAPAPAISVAPDSLTFTSPVGTLPAEQSYAVTGINLTSGITVTAPPDFQVSLTSGNGFSSSISLPTSGGTVFVQSLRTTEGTSTGNITHTSTSATTVNVVVNASLGNAGITTNISSLPTFPNTVVGVPSAEMSYTISGGYLVNPITITAPTGFEVSTTSGSGFGQVVTLTPVNYMIPNTTIYARFYPTEAIAYNGVISHVSNPTVNVSVSGNGIEDNGANAEAVTIYYVTFPEDDVNTTFKIIEPGAGQVISPFHNRVTISIPVAGTLVFYDQWEDGSYDADIANPGANTYNSSTNLDGTQIWGNGSAADGCAPRRISGSSNITTCNDANDVFLAGDIIMIEDDIIVVNPNTSTTIDWDARDKIGASATVAVSHLYWPSGAGVAMSTAHEMYPTSEWGTNYEAPVGEGTINMVGTSNYSETFQHCVISAMASVANTTIEYDLAGDGTYEGSAVKNEGQAVLIADTVQGTRVRSTDAGKPIQALLVCGDIDEGTVSDGYTVRDYTLLPTDKWGSSLWSPVGRSTANGNLTAPVSTRLFIYNPSFNSSIYVTCEKYNLANPASPIFTTPEPVLPRGVMNTDLVNWQGGRCFASDVNGVATSDKIFGIGVFDPTLNTNYDWGFTLYSSDYLTSDLLVGMGFGKDPTNTTSTNNAMPIWATAACSSGSTYLYVDWDNDGTADRIDMNGDGDTADTVNGIAETGSNNGILVNRLQLVTLYEPGLDSEAYDQTGARVWTRTAPGVGFGGVPGCSLTAAWGQDTLSAGSEVGGMIDAGTSIAPLRLIESAKTSALFSDSAPTGWSENDIARYTISVHPLGGTTVSNVRVYDTIPSGTTYEAGTTQYCLANCSVEANWVTIPDNPSGTAFPLDVIGGVLIDDGVITGSETWYVRFNVVVFGDTDTVTNCSTIYSNAGRTIACVRNSVSSNTDWGDLPDTYGTISSSFGPRHTGNGLILGSVWDNETNGQPSATANGDGSDEDGVSLPVGAQTNWNGTFNITVSGDGCLNAWLDFTNNSTSLDGFAPDGNFTRADGITYDYVTISGSDYSEYILQNVVVTSATNSVSINLLPAGLPNGTYFARFRLSPRDASGACTTVITPRGYVYGGEVEDYMFELLVPTSVELLYFGAQSLPGGVQLTWETASETENLGFYLFRATSPEGERTQLNNGALIPTLVYPGAPYGAVYTFIDPNVIPGVTYYYWLQDISIYGNQSMTQGLLPVSVLAASDWLFVPLINR